MDSSASSPQENGSGRRKRERECTQPGETYDVACPQTAAKRVRIRGPTREGHARYLAAQEAAHRDTSLTPNGADSPCASFDADAEPHRVALPRLDSEPVHAEGQLDANEIEEEPRATQEEHGESRTPEEAITPVSSEPVQNGQAPAVVVSCGQSSGISDAASVETHLGSDMVSASDTPLTDTLTPVVISPGLEESVTVSGVSTFEEDPAGATSLEQHSGPRLPYGVVRGLSPQHYLLSCAGLPLKIASVDGCPPVAQDHDERGTFGAAGLRLPEVTSLEQVSDGAFVQAVTAIFQRLIDSNDSLGRSRTCDEAAEPLRMFFSKVAQTFPMESYIERIVLNIPSRPMLITALVLIDRITRVHRDMSISEANMHRIFIIGVMLAYKNLEDEPCSQDFFRIIGGVPSLEELNDLEVAFLRLIDWRCFVEGSVYEMYNEAVLSCIINMYPQGVPRQ